jgi:signal transduction histidine kinase
MARPQRFFWQYIRGLAAPVLLWGLFLSVLWNTLQSRLQGDREYDRAALREWIEESRAFRDTLPGLVRSYLETADPESGQPDLLPRKALEILEQLKSLADPTKIYGAQLPLFPTIYRLELEFPNSSGPALTPIVWESGVPRPRHNPQVQQLEDYLLGGADHRALLRIEYQLHAYNKLQQDERAAAVRFRWVAGLATAATALAFVWVYLVQHREQERERRRLAAQQQIAQAQHLALENELRREEAERRHEEAERKLLEQRLATQAAQRRALELKSQLYANIGIMAGSYAHNIKNLLVRPNDLLRRCLESDGLTGHQGAMLHEVRQTLGTVTERLQQILQTVRRDPSHSELAQLDLNHLVGDLWRSWEDLARDKWKLTLQAELWPEPLLVEADWSHLQQAVENLLFNARDATFEMRNQLRVQARRGAEEGGRDRREALIAAAAWKGEITMRTRRQRERAILEVQDNGIGMSEDVRQRCTETHFSTKRDNAVYEGNSTGMGLGLSFVAVILEHHGAELEVESAPLQGALFRLWFPLAAAAPEAAPQAETSRKE